MKYNSDNIEFQWHSTGQLILTFQSPMEMVNELNTLFDELTTLNKLPKINETLVGKIDNEYSLYLNHTEPDGTPSKDNHNFMPPDILKWLEDRIHQYLQFNFIEHRGTKTHSIWINDYKQGEYNPIHKHEGDNIFKSPLQDRGLQEGLIGMLSLKMPDMGPEFVSNAVPTNGQVVFISNASGQFTNRLYKPKCEAGTFIVFPYDMLHTVYPHFNQTETRRTMPINIDVYVRSNM